MCWLVSICKYAHATRHLGLLWLIPSWNTSRRCSIDNNASRSFHSQISCISSALMNRADDMFLSQNSSVLYFTHTGALSVLSSQIHSQGRKKKKKNNYEAETRALSKLPSKHGFDLQAGVDTTIHLVGNRVRQALSSPSVHTANGQQCLVYSMRS